MNGMKKQKPKRTEENKALEAPENKAIDPRKQGKRGGLGGYGKK